ncbi:phytanoyl-CoA dioxygenase family protein [Hymenobacter sp. HDW8]|uniref:phytanoyl-CoA dioxygenase family protein n=1 Tax=Hymenobacter sp. HDW8 TaxID=2714932 RepID=UPI00140E3227|nr:phytanoyl-CoA dioxygenase family protein [Hymenobacter sp. HDW8]QIL74459.1 phytanoyl-CoA dioxygenase family protein [Hymenobacter sp. HDW8]
MKASINAREVTYQIEGESGQAENKVLLADSIDLTRGTSWADDGYTVAEFLSAPEQRQLQAGLEALVREALVAAGLPVAADFPVADYHKVIGDDQQRHLAVVNLTKEYTIDRLPVPAALLEARVSELCGHPVQAYNPFDQMRLFHLRLVRPGRFDNNPLHRDVWLPDYDDCINIYVPVTGSTADSSLSLVPGSHWWPENRVERTQNGAVYNGVTYTVPAVKQTAEPLELIRPNPGPAEVLLFSPYLLHGGAVNLNADATRLSLEMRFWPVETIG